MEYRNLGRSGLKLSALSYGAWVTFDTQLQVDAAKQCMVAAYDAGVNFFDNAEAYAAGKAETIMGQVLKQNGWRRDSYVVSSKVFFGCGQRGPTQRGLSRKHVLEACHQALERLQLDYLDLYFCHRPDPDTPIEETVWAMHSLIMQGKILYWGTSEWSAQQITQAHQVARQYNLIPPLMEQSHYNLFHRKTFEKDYAPLYRDYGMGTTIWSPLASGFLTGKYLDGVPEDSRLALPGYEWLRDALLGPGSEARFEAVRSLAKIADALGISLAELSLAWCLKNPNVSTVIMGATKVSQIEQNLKALEATPKLDENVMQQIANIIKDIEV